MPNNMASLINPGLTWVNSALPFINAGTSSLLNSRQSIIDPKSIINRGSTINQGTTLTGDALQNIIDIYSRNSLLGQTGSNLLSGINKEKFQVNLLSIYKIFFYIILKFLKFLFRQKKRRCFLKINQNK